MLLHDVHIKIHACTSDDDLYRQRGGGSHGSSKRAYTDEKAMWISV